MQFFYAKHDVFEFVMKLSNIFIVIVKIFFQNLIHEYYVPSQIDKNVIILLLSGTYYKNLFLMCVTFVSITSKWKIGCRPKKHIKKKILMFYQLHAK